MWKVLVFGSALGAGSETMLVFEDGVTLVVDAVTSLDPTLLEVSCWLLLTEANVRIADVGLKAERDAARRRDDVERRAAIL